MSSDFPAEAKTCDPHEHDWIDTDFYLGRKFYGEYGTHSAIDDQTQVQACRRCGVLRIKLEDL